MRQLSAPFGWLAEAGPWDLSEDEMCLPTSWRGSGVTVASHYLLKPHVLEYPIIQEVSFFGQDMFPSVYHEVGKPFISFVTMQMFYHQ